MTSGCGRAGSAECITKGSRCIGVVLIKIEMNVSGSSRKGHDSLSPKLVEYLSAQQNLGRIPAATGSSPCTSNTHFTDTI